MTFASKGIQSAANKAGHRKGVAESGTEQSRAKKKSRERLFPVNLNTWQNGTAPPGSQGEHSLISGGLLQAGHEILLKNKGKARKWQQNFVSSVMNLLKVACDVLTPEFTVCNERNTCKNCNNNNNNKEIFFLHQENQRIEGLEFDDHDSYIS